MGVTSNSLMHFDLSALFHSTIDLQQLVEPFLKEEIDQVVKQMSPDKALGLDGFNGHFMKKCRSITKNDFYRLCDDFYNESVNLESINSSLITLVPKTNSPMTLKDFRPIYLHNDSLKLKNLLLDHLQLVITRLIHQNQYSFIMTRSIQDCLVWCFEQIHQCPQPRRGVVILKLVFEKGF